MTLWHNIYWTGVFITGALALFVALPAAHRFIIEEVSDDPSPAFGAFFYIWAMICAAFMAVLGAMLWPGAIVLTFVFLRVSNWIAAKRVNNMEKK